MSHMPFDDLMDLAIQMPELPRKQTDIYDSTFPISTWLANAQHRPEVKLNEIHICILASSYAAVDGSKAETKEIEEFVAAASRGQTRVNQLCKHHGLGLRVLELAPTLPHTVGENWSEAECMAAVAFGMEATAAGGDLLCLGSYSINDAGYLPTLVDQVIRLRGAAGDCNPIDFLHLLKNLGGRDSAASLGALLAARSRQLPVFIEGWSALAAYSILQQIAPRSTDHVLLASVQSEKQRVYAQQMGLTPLVGVSIESGPGCGSALAVSLALTGAR